MKLIKTKNYKELSEKASKIVVSEINKKPKLVIGFATGKTPLGMYKLLTEAYKNKKVNFSKIKAFNLDEYHPISKKDKKSFYYYLHKNLFDKINVKKENINILNGEAKNPERECERYEKLIRKQKIDLMILGVGENGHIAFNEPGSLENSKTRIVELKHRAVKKKALTIGISTIINSKKILLLASGKNKARAVKSLVKGKVDKKCPVSFLKKHKNLIIIIDKEAGRLL